MELYWQYVEGMALYGEVHVQKVENLALLIFRPGNEASPCYMQGPNNLHE